MAYAIKSAVPDPRAERLAFPAQKTMYRGKAIRPGDEIFVFDSETAGGAGLIARGVVTTVEAVPRTPGVARQTPKVSLTVARTAFARRPLGRAQLKAFAGNPDAGPEAELHFKFYRQATDKVVGLSDAASTFLAGFF